MQKWKDRLRQLMDDIPAVVLAMKHPRTPAAAKLLAALTVAYALSPIDLIPDFIPVLGYLDDLIILPGLIALTLRRIPPDVFAECRDQAAGMTSQAMQGKWYHALPVVLIWIGLIALVVCALK